MGGAGRDEVSAAKECMWGFPLVDEPLGGMVNGEENETTCVVWKVFFSCTSQRGLVYH